MMVDQKHHQIAHDLDDPNKIRSKDVTLNDQQLTFRDLKLSEQTNLGLEKNGFQRPTPAQLEAIPLGRCGFDLVVQSKAGTGKTCIFTIIALEALRFNPENCFQSLIVAPTREIANQIHFVIKRVGCFFQQLEVILCTGGVDLKKDRERLRGTCQIVVGTPGRLKQLIDLNILKSHQVELFVLDEADKLMDNQFKNQIDEIYKRLPDDKQMIVTSATYPNELSRFLKRYMRSPIEIKFGVEVALDAIEEYYFESKAGHSKVKTLEMKYSNLSLMLKKLHFEKCFIFTNYQQRAPEICKKLNSDQEFFDRFGSTNYLCAELSQEKRNQVLNVFRTSDQRLLVSTDISARGIDIRDVDLVVNFDLPQDRATYYHRIGRAGRFGQAGKAISIVSPDCLSQFNSSVNSDKINKLIL